MKKLQNRNTRIILRFPESKKLKDKIFLCRDRKETVELFDGMLVSYGETLILQSLVDINDDNNPQWIDQEIKTHNKNKPRLPYQGEYVSVPDPK